MDALAHRFYQSIHPFWCCPVGRGIIRFALMSIESDSERGVRAAVAASVSTARTQCEAKRAEVQRLREHLDKVRAGEDDEDALLLALAQPMGSTDPLSCLCCCKFKRLGQSYVRTVEQ